jgi:glycosyltransferase involved in cell wall biosynthesis
MSKILVDKSNSIDVLIIGEGTYPYIQGGVSSWINQLINKMPDIKFGVIFLGTREEDYEGMKYKLPDNLVFLSTTYLFDFKTFPDYDEINVRNKEVIKDLQVFFSENYNSKIIENLNYEFFINKLTLKEFLYAKDIFYWIEDFFIEHDDNVSFIDFFWTVRNILIPLWKISELKELLENRKIGLIHSPSTGYAGVCGVMIKKEFKRPYIVTEHGIYTRERKLDILNSSFEDTSSLLFGSSGVNIIQKLWINFFMNMGKVVYDVADRVYALFERARQIQIEFGCDEKKTEVIPNGVEINKYLVEKVEKKEKIIAFIGRVAPIKDVKSFIKMIKILSDDDDTIRGWIVGPMDEDPEYAEECKMLVDVLNLKDKIKFLGFQKLTDIFPKTDLVALTSISEGMPLVLLEAFDAKIPCIATDVGACSQLIYGGLNEEDKKIGKAGEVVRVADVKGMAEAAKKLLNNKEFYDSCKNAAKKRVEKFYRLSDMINKYKKIYLELKSK